MPLVIGLQRWRYFSPAARIIVYYYGFWSVEAFVDPGSRKALHTNIYLYHVTVLVETWLLGWAYYHTYDLKPIRRVMPWVGALFTWVALIDGGPKPAEPRNVGGAGGADADHDCAVLRAVDAGSALR